MSVLTYIASDYPLEERPNPHERLVSVNEALALGKTDIHDFLLAPGFDRDEPGVILWTDRDVVFDIDHGEIRDGGLDDDFSLLRAEGLDGIFTEKKHAVSLEWHCYTEGRAGMVIDYIRENLRHTDEAELWHIWMGSGEKPLIRSRTIPISELVPEDIKTLISSNVTEEFYEIPIQYRIVITEE